MSVRINRVTPITPTSLVTLALLGTGDRALSVSETSTALANLHAYVRARNLPTTHEFELDTPEGVRRALDDLVENDVVSRFDEGSETVYRIGPEQQLKAAYYRNSIIHFFLNPAILELSLLAAAETESGTTMTAAPRPSAVFTFLETARNVHIPRKKLSARFSMKTALTKMPR